MRRSPTARVSMASGWGGAGGKAGVRHVQTMSAAPRMVTLPNAQAVPTTDAMPPRTGP